MRHVKSTLKNVEIINLIFSLSLLSIRVKTVEAAFWMGSRWRWILFMFFCRYWRATIQYPTLKGVVHFTQAITNFSNITFWIQHYCCWPLPLAFDEECVARGRLLPLFQQYPSIHRVVMSSNFIAYSMSQPTRKSMFKFQFWSSLVRSVKVRFSRTLKPRIVQ